MPSTTGAQTGPKPGTTRRPPRRISKEQFLRDYSNREDGFKYEWNDGVVEKASAMNQQQSRFFHLLLGLFSKTEASRRGGMLITETDMATSVEQLRRPDIAFYTGEQLPKMWAGENQIAPWVAEVISPTDRAENMYEKLEEYFRAGVQVVWHIFPHAKRVDVYTSPDDMTICRGQTLCSGAPVLPGFEIRAEELFG